MTRTWRIPPEWTGRRVVVRYRLDGVQLTDAVGELLDAGDPLRLATRRGEVRIARAAVVTAKVVPPRPSRPGPPHTTLSIADMKRVEVQHWRPVESEPLGRWLLQAHHGVTGRANSVLALGLRADLDATLETVAGWYTARGLPPLMALPVPGDAAVSVAGPPSEMPGPAAAAALHRHGHSTDGEEQLALRSAVEAAGWVCGGSVSAYTLTAATAAQVDPAGATGAPPPRAAIISSDTPDSLWQNLYRSEELPSPVLALLMSAEDQVFVSVRLGAQTVAIGRGSHAAGWVGVTAVEVAPQYRRRGLGRSVLAEIARWGRLRRARSMFVQTAAGNREANRLYLSAGFTVHHRYDYLTPG